MEKEEGSRKKDLRSLHVIVGLTPPRSCVCVEYAVTTVSMAQHRLTPGRYTAEGMLESQSQETGQDVQSVSTLADYLLKPWKRIRGLITEYSKCPSHYPKSPDNKAGNQNKCRKKISSVSTQPKCWEYQESNSKVPTVTVTKEEQRLILETNEKRRQEFSVYK